VSGLPRVGLALLPTPLEQLPRLAESLGGPRLLVKRDDLTGLGGGGNKTRKLEYLVADALEWKSDSLITVGSAQSNHCRQTAAAAARCGLKCTLVLRGHPPDESTGNVLLDELLGADIRWSGDREREDVMADVVKAERAAGRNPYPIPLGGSNGTGSYAYAMAVSELLDQMTEKIDWIVVASSSGGTQAGLAAGAAAFGFEGKVLGVSIDEDQESLQSTVAEIASDVSVVMGQPRQFSPSDILVNADYLGAGYGVLSSSEIGVIRMFARTEGLLLDPVYTGRAAAGMVDLIRKGFFRRDETVLFWHTGGTPALFAYARDLRGA
jgi:D-cysteine desulfhydrase